MVAFILHKCYKIIMSAVTSVSAQLFIKGKLIMASAEQNTVKAFIDTDKNLLNMPSSTEYSAPERQQIKHILIGQERAVTGTIRVLHQLGYASVGDWSPLLPSSNPGEVMSILVRSISVR